jgi:hypothetical protein
MSKELIARGRTLLTMSMFATPADLFAELNRQRGDLADALERAEERIAELEAGGCTRGQRTTQWCAEAVEQRARAEAADGQRKRVAKAEAEREALAATVRSCVATLDHMQGQLAWNDTRRTVLAVANRLAEAAAIAQGEQTPRCDVCGATSVRECTARGAAVMLCAMTAEGAQGEQTT